MGAHARFSPSAANRLIHCPPSLVLGEAFQEEESPYAAEGSAGHALAEHLIKKHLKQQTRRPVSDYYSDDLLEAVDDYVSFVVSEIEAARKECPDLIFSVEQRVDVSDYVPDCFGTADMVIVTDKLVHIIDLKLGKGVPVYAEKNPQLMIYGLGVLEIAEMLFPVETVRLTIFQPRLSNSSTWEIAPEELKAWGDEVLRPAEENLKLVQMEFKEPALLTDNEISEVLKQADELSKWAADVYAYAQDQAIVHHKQWNGFKLVMGKSNRKYTSEEEVAAAAKAAGYTDIYKHTLLGITDMERLMGKKEFARILGALVHKPAGKITLVPESDKREAIQTSTAEADFQKED